MAHIHEVVESLSGSATHMKVVLCGWVTLGITPGEDIWLVLTQELIQLVSSSKSTTN